MRSMRWCDTNMVNPTTMCARVCKCWRVSVCMSVMCASALRSNSWMLLPALLCLSPKNAAAKTTTEHVVTCCRRGNCCRRAATANRRIVRARHTGRRALRAQRASASNRKTLGVFHTLGLSFQSRLVSTLTVSPAIVPTSAILTLKPTKKAINK